MPLCLIAVFTSKKSRYNAIKMSFLILKHWAGGKREVLYVANIKKMFMRYLPSTFTEMF